MPDTWAQVHCFQVAHAYAHHTAVHIASWVAQTDQFAEYVKYGSMRSLEVQRATKKDVEPMLSPDEIIMLSKLNSFGSGDNMPYCMPCQCQWRLYKCWFWVIMSWETETSHFFQANQVCMLNDEEYATVRDI